MRRADLPYLVIAAGEKTWILPPGLKPDPLPPVSFLASRSGVSYKAAVQVVQGPAPGTSWLIPNRVLCGEPPLEDEQLEKLLKAGIDTFVDLRHESEIGGAGTYRWRVEQHCLNMDPKPTFAVFSVPETLKPGEIPDTCVGDDDEVAKLVLNIISATGSGSKIYIHCSTGLQRSATIGALVVGMVHQLSGRHALLLYQVWNAHGTALAALQPVVHPALTFQRYRSYHCSAPSVASC